MKKVDAAHNSLRRKLFFLRMRREVVPVESLNLRRLRDCKRVKESPAILLARLLEHD